MISEKFSLNICARSYNTWTIFFPFIVPKYRKKGGKGYTHTERERERKKERERGTCLWQPPVMIFATHCSTRLEYL